MSVLDRIVRKHVCRDEIRVPVVKPVLHEGRTVLGYGTGGELADKAAEIGRHQHDFQALEGSCVELRIDEPQKVEEVLHGQVYVFYSTSARECIIS